MDNKLTEISNSITNLIHEYNQEISKLSYLTLIEYIIGNKQKLNHSILNYINSETIDILNQIFNRTIFNKSIHLCNNKIIINLNSRYRYIEINNSELKNFIGDLLQQYITKKDIQLSLLYNDIYTYEIEVNDLIQYIKDL